MLHQVGAGALGPVFRAHDPEGGRLVAIKAFRLDITPEHASRLAAALQALVDLGLDHPSIAAPIAAGVESSGAWLAQAYVPAESLDSAVRQYGPPPPTDALALVTHLAGALDFAAASNVLHGSLHLRDVLVAPDETHLVDLGVAAALESVGLKAPVRPPWTAPERVAGAPASRAADVFALGMIALELLTGVRPAGSGPDAIASMPDVPGANRGALADVFRTALAAKPAERFKSALALAAALKLALGDTTGRPAPHVKRPRRTPSRDDTAMALPLDSTEAPGARAVPGTRAETPVQPSSASPAAAFDQPPTAPGPGEAPRVVPARAAHRRSEQADAGSDRAVVAPAAAAGVAAREELRSTPEPEHAPALDGVSLREGDHDLDLQPPAEAAPAWDAPEATSELDAAEAVARDAAFMRGARADNDDTRGTPWFALAAMLIVGLIAGFAGGYLVGSRGAAVTTETAAGVTSSGATVAPAAPAGGATEVQVPPEVIPEPAEPAPARPPVSAGPSSEPVGPAESRAGSAGAAPAASASPSAPATGRLTVRTTPAGARVEVNGDARGSTPLTLNRLPLGGYTIRVSRDGYATEQRRVTLARGRTSQTLTVPLRRVAAAAAPARSDDFTGTVMVESRPAGARVYLDGRLVGTTPLLLSQIAAGSHVVRLERDGHSRWTTEIRVVAGERQQVRASLEEVISR